MPDDRELEERLSRMIAAARAEANPALWTRARARIESRAPLPGLLGWAMRPAALGASLALLVAVGCVSALLIASAPATYTIESGNLVEALLAERGVEEIGGLVAPEPAGGGAVIDSGVTQ